MKFHDVHIYAGAELATTGSRLELGAKNPFLRKIFSGMKYCDGCLEPVVIIFPEADEDKSTLREAFDKLSHFKSGLSIIQSKYYVNFKISNRSKYISRSCEGQLSVGSAESPDHQYQGSLQQDSVRQRAKPDQPAVGLAGEDNQPHLGEHYPRPGLRRSSRDDEHRQPG